LKNGLLTTENKNGRGNHATAQSRHSKKNWLFNGRIDQRDENWKKRKKYGYGKRDDGDDLASRSQDMCGDLHHENRLAIGLLRGRMKRRKSVFESGDARGHGVGRLRTKMILLSVERSEIRSVVGIVLRVMRYAFERANGGHHRENRPRLRSLSGLLQFTRTLSHIIVILITVRVIDCIPATGLC
jgi:hypothetical protein